MNREQTLTYLKNKIPSQEYQLFEAISKWYEAEIGTIDLQIKYKEFGGNYDSYGDTITIPAEGQNGGRIPVANIYNRPTFLMYDSSVGIVHELGHYILNIIKGNDGTLLDKDELNIATLATATSVALKESQPEKVVEELRKIYGYSSDFDEVDYKSVAWSHTKKLSIASSSEGSFENVFNSNRNFYQEAGLSKVPNKYRTGYVTHENVGDDKEWTSFSANTSDGTKGKWTTLRDQGKDVVFLGNQYDNIIEMGAGDDYIDGGHGNDTLRGGDGKNILQGGSGEDTIIGGVHDDLLIGGINGGDDDGAKDILKGGDGFDTYIVSNTDEITDDDGNGKIDFDGIDLSGRKTLLANTEIYQDDNFFYEKKGEALVVTKKKNEEYITIFGFDFGGTGKNNGLGIELVDNMDIEVSIISPASVAEGDSRNESLEVTVHLSRVLEDGEILEVSVSNTDERTYTFTSGEQSKTLTHSWRGDTRDEDGIRVTFTPTASYTGPTEEVNVTVISGMTAIYDDDGGSGNNNDDDDRTRLDPLALDMDKDGFISTSSLDESGTYFDITGDGLKERVGWIQSNDALLTYDKNENGQIDGISEVFGNPTESGFEELKRLIDSNHDNIIDRKDELYTRLQVWNDYNQDAKVQDGELRTLKEAGIKSIDLNYVSTNIEINGNLIAEASKYTNADGVKELAADILLATDVKDTKVDIEDIPNFTIDPDTYLLPQLKGTGLVYDSFIRYNIDPEFKALAQDMSTNMLKVATEFDGFIEQYSGYTAFVNEMRERDIVMLRLRWLMLIRKLG